MLTLVSVIVACAKSNPLLGEWQYTRSRLLPSTSMGSDANYTLVFKEEYMLLKGTKINIEYKFKKDGTALLFSDGYVSYIKFLSDDLIMYQTLRGRAREFARK